MSAPFDREEAKKFLRHREMLEKGKNEEIRKKILQKTVRELEEEFAGQGVEVYLIGSLTRPNAFTESSDIDIVLKNFKGDRFALWSKLAQKMDREIEIILYETCSFKDYVVSQGYKVL